MEVTAAPARRTRRLPRLLVAATTIIAVALVVPAVALADAPNPDSISQVSLISNPDGSTTLTVQGTWDWGSGGPCDSGNDKKAVGYAIDWNDVDQAGNLVASGVEVGTPTDNLVRPADNVSFVVCTTNTGTWGPISHTYSATTPLPSTVCAVTYDVHFDNEGQIAASGNHSTKAGGTDHNTDNSVEANAIISGGNCEGLVVSTAATFRSFTAKRSPGAVTLRWRTAAEAEVLGYNVYAQVNGKRVKLNKRLIAGKGVSGGSYAFKYRTPKGKKAPARFWVETVNLDGTRNWRSVRAL